MELAARGGRCDRFDFIFERHLDRYIKSKGLVAYGPNGSKSD